MCIECEKVIFSLRTGSRCKMEKNIYIYVYICIRKGVKKKT